MMFPSSRVLVLVTFILTWYSFPDRIPAQSVERLSGEETQELLDAMAGKHPALDLKGALRRLKNVDSIPDTLVPSIIGEIGAQSHFTRFQATRLLEKIDCDVRRAALLLDSVGKLSGYRADHLRIEEFVDWITMLGTDVVPLLHRTVMGKDNSQQQRTLALLGLARLKPLPDPVVDDLSTLLKTPAGSWGEAARILAEHGEFGEKKLVSLLDTPNEWGRVRAAGALEVEFPRKYPRAMVVLLRIAHSDYHRNRLGSCLVSPNEEAVAFLGQTGPQNTLSMLEVGLHNDTRGGRMRSALTRMAANEEYQAEILETALPVLNHWIEDRKRRDGALLWYGSLGRAKPQVVGDLAAVVKTTDDDFAVKIALTMKRTGGPAGILVAGRLLADPATRKHALEILRGAEAKAGPIAKDVIRELIVCDQAEVQSDQSERYKRSLRHILTKTDTIPSEAIPVLIELDAISPVYRGDIISWLQKNSSPLSTSIARQMREWNRQAVVAEIQGDYYSRENVHTKKRTKRAAISPDAKQLAVLEEKQLRLLDISSGEQFRAVDLPYGVGEWHRLGFDPSGRYLVATYLRSSFVWEFATGKLLTHDAPSDLNVLSDPNILQGGNVQVVFGKRKYRGPAVIDLELRDLSTGKRIGQATYPVNNPRSRNRAPGWLHLQLSPGGSVLALLYTGGIVEIRQTPDLEVVAELNLVDEFPQTQFDRPQFTADGKTLVFAGDDGYLRFWDYPDPENIRTTYTGRSGPYWLLGQGQWVLHRDCHGQSTAMLADTSGNRTPVSLYFGASDPDITVTANGKFFEVATHNGIRLFETAKLEKYFTQKRSDK